MAETPNFHYTETEAESSSKPLSPQLKIEPASEWANDTFSALDPSNLATSPSLNFPGSYPYSPTTLEPGPTLEEIKEAAQQYIHAVGQFVPSHENVQKIAHSASNTVREYFPNNISTYLGPMNSTQEAIPTSPLEESETSPSSGGGFVLINRGTSATKDETQSVPESQHVLGDKPAQVPSELSGAPRAKLLRLESKHGKNDTNSIQTDLASENASLKVLPGSEAASIRLHDSVPTPYSYTARYEISRSTSNSGAILSNGHVDQHMSDIDEGVKAPDNNGDHDVVPGPSGEGSGTVQKAGVVSGIIPGPEDGFPASTENEGSNEELGSIERNASPRNVGNRKEERELGGVGIKQDEQTGVVGGKLGANTDNEGAASTSEAIKSPPPATRQRQKDASTNGNPRPQSPMTSVSNQLAAQAMSGPDAKKLPDPSSNSSPAVNPSKGQRNSGRKKGNFVQRLKTWSKKLSQNKKRQSEDHTAMV